MIKVILTKDAETENIIFKVNGHAKSAPKGEDLVCAVASGYVHQLKTAVEAISKNGWLVKEPEITVEDGKAEIIYHPSELYRSIVEYMTMMIATGFDWLQKEYPEYVKLN